MYLLSFDGKWLDLLTEKNFPRKKSTRSDVMYQPVETMWALRPLQMKLCNVSNC